MFDLIIGGYRFLYLQLAALVGYGWAIVALSFICSFLMLPLMRAVAGVVRREKEYESVIDPQVAAITSKYASDMERHLHIQRLYARYGYSPLSAVKKVLPLFVQIPFLLLTYYMLKGTSELSGVSFLFLGDLGKADFILRIPLLSSPINLLPLVMTFVNVITVFSTPGFTRRDWTQAIGIALLFLVLLYTAPSALLLYWTLNNIITMVRTLVAKKCEGARLLCSRIMLFAGVCSPVRVLANIAWPSLTWCTPLVLVRNYILLLLCVFLPTMFLIFGHMPDRLEVDIHTEAPLSMSAGFLVQNADGKNDVVGEIVQGCPLGHHKDPVSFFMADGCDTKALQIRLSGSDYSYVVSSVSLVRHLVFRYRIPYVIEDHVVRCSSDPIFEGVEIPNVKGSYLAFKGALFGLVLLAAFGLFIRPKPSTPFEWKLSLAISCISAFFFTVILPCQTIFTNRDAFDFPVANIVTEVGLIFVIAAAAIFAILILATIVYGRWPHMVLLGVLVYEYLQTGVLSINAPRMDGNMNYYWKTDPMMIDFAVMAAIGVLLLCKATWIKTHFRRLLIWCVFGLCVTVTMAIYDATRRPLADVTASQKQEFLWNFQRRQVVNGIKYSPVRNVIVLVLDSTQSDAAYEAAKVDLELRSAFDGFTAFNNHVGMHDNTYSGSVGLLTGEYYLNDMPMSRHYEKCWGDKSFVTPYLQADYPVYLLPGIMGAFSNRLENDHQEQSYVRSLSVFLRRVKPMNTSLLDVLQLRLVPFFLKKWDLQVMYLGSEASDGTVEEHSLYPELAKRSVGSEARTMLLYVHTEGTHAPIRYDEFGNRLWKDKDHYRGLCGETHYILKSVAAYLRDLKRIGIYDNSMIVVTADHGCCFATPQLPKVKNLPTRAVPMLWIKPFGAHGDLAQTEEPTSHSKFVDVMRLAKDRDVTMSEITNLLKTDTRRFVIDHDGYVNLYVDADGSLIQNK